MNKKLVTKIIIHGFVIIMIGISLMPHLILEERTHKTLDALLDSLSDQSLKALAELPDDEGTK